MFYESSVLDSRTIEILHSAGPILKRHDFSLVGGTALAIQINHRKSIDLDFFSQKEFDEEALLEELRISLSDEFQIEVMKQVPQTLNLLIDSVKVDLIRYRYPILKPQIELDDYAMLAVEDIAAMKLSAITNRGCKKDFFDLYFLLRQFQLETIFDFYRTKFPESDTFSVVRSLVYFEDADSEPDPILISSGNADWSSVKEAISTATQNLSS